MKFTYAAGAWPETEPDPQPELRAGFEALGFRVIGAAMMVLPTTAQIERVVANYADGDRQLIGEWQHRPSQVMAAPDGIAFVRLDWFWSGRWAEISTVLPDGRLITTATDWGVDPVWPRQIRRWYAATTNRGREQLLRLSPSASAMVVDGNADDAWRAHRAHVADVRGDGPAPSGHVRLTDAIAVIGSAQASRNRTNRRAQWLAFLISLPVMFAVVLAANLFLRLGILGGAAVALLAAALWIVTAQQVWLRARHWRWLRPRFRAPVPRAGS